MASVQIFSTAAGDGPCGYLGPGGGTWADVRNQSPNGNSANAAATRSYACISDYNNSVAAGYANYRGRLVFDLASNLPAGATITAATLSTYCYAKVSTGGGSIGLVASTQASASALANSDYPLVGTTEFMTRQTFSGVSSAAYNTFTLNASGVSFLTTNQAGNAMFAFRSSFDIDNSAPTDTSYYAISYSDQTGTSEDPYLTVTYTPAATGSVPVSPSRRTRGLYTR